MLAELQLVGDEELAADDEEKNDAGENVAKGVIQAENGADLAGTPVQEHQQEGSEHHGKGIELGRRQWWW